MVVSNRVTSRTTVLLHSRYLEPSEFSERGTFLKGLCICPPVFKDDFLALSWQVGGLQWLVSWRRYRYLQFLPLFGRCQISSSTLTERSSTLYWLLRATALSLITSLLWMGRTLLVVRSCSYSRRALKALLSTRDPSSWVECHLSALECDESTVPVSLLGF